MSLTVAETKRLLRRRVQARQERAGREEMIEASLRLCAQLRAQPLWQQSQAILSFFPLPGEPDIRPLLAEALAEGKLLALPRFHPGRRDYEAREVTTLSDLRTGHFDIPEPAPECGRVEFFRLDLILVPGVAFDVTGSRLGRGKGYFDRLLAQVRGHTCGVAFDWQVVPEVPVEPHDVRVNSLLTPTRWSPCEARGAVL